MTVKRIFRYFLLLQLFSINQSQNLFDIYHVHDLNIIFYNPNYDEILQNRWEENNKTYELAQIE